MASKYVLYNFKVKPKSDGSGMIFGFPVDMLRLECCYPVAEKDSARITQSIAPGLFKNGFRKKLTKVWEVELQHFGYKHWRPQAERWDSFGWEVSSGETY